MNKIMHPIEPEELMAYLDGELAPEREAVAVAHLKECGECQNLIADLGKVSKALESWQTPTIQVPMSPAIQSEFDAQREPETKALNLRSNWWAALLHPTPAVAWVGMLAVVLVIVVGTVRMIGGNANNVFSMVAADHLAKEVHTGVPASQEENRQFDRIQQFAKLEKSPGLVGGGGGGGNRDALKQDRQAVSAALVPAGPMIIRSAQLSLITKDFDKVRESVESILKRHRGYIGDLKVGGSTGSSRTLAGTLRVPADQLDATIADLKPLGRIDSESQSGQDVTSRYVDLQARLMNARNTEQRLTDLLRNRTGKLSDVLEVEQELDRVRGEIEQMEAERKNMSNQVSYATLNLTVAEDYKAQLEVVPPSTSTRLSNAAVEGYRSVVDGILSVALFLLSTGPTLLVWGLILFFPARLVWRKLRPMAQ